MPTERNKIKLWNKCMLSFLLVYRWTRGDNRGLRWELVFEQRKCSARLLGWCQPTHLIVTVEIVCHFSQFCSNFYLCSFIIHWRCTMVLKYVTLDHKTSLNCYFFEIKIHTSSESWIKKLSIDVGLLRSDNIWLRNNYLKIWNLRVRKNWNIEKIAFKVVQMKFLVMHITNQKLSFDVFTVRNLQNIFMEHDVYLIS